MKGLRHLSTNLRVLESLKKSSIERARLNIIEKSIKGVTGLFLFPFGLTTVEVNNVGLIYRFGKYDGYMTEGLNWLVPFGKIVGIYCGDRTINYNDINLTDSNKNPIKISSFITYNVTNP